MKRAVLAMGLCLGLTRGLWADTVVTKDGRRLVGEVTKVEAGYSVKTKFGLVTVTEGDFSEWIKGDAPATADKPAPAKSTAPVVAAPAARPTPGGKKVDPKLLEALLKQGREALAAGEYKAARDAFHDAAEVDPKNVEALHGNGLAAMYLNDFTHALPPMEKALLANPAPNRALVLNMAVCQIGQPGSKNAMRAAIVIKDYLAAHPTALDEPLLNAMATALFVADEQAKKGNKFKELEVFYTTYNQKLEAAKPGMKRWGVQWMKAGEVAKRLSENAAIDKQLVALGKDMDLIDGKVADKSREVDVLKDKTRRGFSTEYEMNAAVRELKSLTDTFDEKQKTYEDLQAKYQRPSFPKAMTLVAMDDLTPPAVAANVSVAEVTPTETLVAPPVKRKTTKSKPEKTTINTEMPKTDNPPVETSMITVNTKPAEHRKVRITSYAAAFPVTDTLVLTAAAPLAGATEIDLQAPDGTPLKAEVVRTDEATGLALLRVSGHKLTPLVLAPSFTGGAVQVAAFASVNIFNPVAEPIPGTARVTAGDCKVNLSRHPRLGGSPVLAGNKVVGVELAARDTDPTQIPTAPLDAIKKLLGSDLPSAPAASPEACAVMLQLTATRESSGT